MNSRSLFFLFFLVGSFALNLSADTNWTAGSGEFVSLNNADCWSNGAPTNTNPGTISGTTEKPIILSLTTKPDYNNCIFSISQTQITINDPTEKKFALLGTSTLTMSNASTLTASRIWATWGGTSTVNFILNDTSSITVNGTFSAHTQQSASTGVGTVNITLNDTSNITSTALDVRGIVNLSGAATGTFSAGNIYVQDETIATTDGKQTLNINGGTLTGTALYNHGVVNLNGGTLKIDSYSNASKGSITLAGGTLAAGKVGMNITSPIEVKGGTNSTIDIGSYNMTISGSLSGSGTINRTGGLSTLYLGGNNSEFSGTLNMNAMNTYFALNETGSQAGSSKATWNIASGATLSAQGTSTIELGALTGKGTLRNDVAGNTLFRIGGKNTNEVFSGSIRDNSSGISTIIVTAIEKVGSGSWTLSGTNAFSGGTTLTEGTIVTASNSAFGSGKIILNGGTLSQNAVYTISNPIEVKGGTTSTIDIGSYNMTISGSLSGSGTINRTGGLSTLYLGGNNSEFSGTLNMNAMNTYFALNETGSQAGSSKATWNIASGATLSAQGTSTIELGALTGKGTLRNDVTGNTLFRIGGKNTNEVFSGSIRDNSSGISTTIVTAIEKVGSGSWTLSGTNAFSGGTTVSGGRLNVNGNLTGNLTVTNGALFSPGQDGAEGRNSIGTTTLAGDAVINGGILLLEADGTNFDQFYVNSLEFVNGGKMRIAPIDGYKPEMGDTFAFLTSVQPLPNVDWNSLLDPVSSSNWSIYANGNTLYASIPLPEPASGLLFALSLTLGLALMRRMRAKSS